MNTDLFLWRVVTISDRISHQRSVADYLRLSAFICGSLLCCVNRIEHRLDRVVER